MLDYFAALDLPRRAALSAEAVRSAFQDIGSRCHPDKSSDPAERERLAAAFAAMNEAHAVLSSTPRRLQHLLTLLTGETPRSGTLPESVMALFGKIGTALQAADAVIAERDAAQSALGQALLAGETMQVQETLEGLAGEVLCALESAAELLDEIDLALAANDPNALAKLASAAQTFAFLQRWDGQIQSRRMRLFD